MYAEFADNLTTSLWTLREVAEPEATIMVMTYYNPLSGTGIPLEIAADDVIRGFNDIIKAKAAEPGLDIIVVDAYPLFAGRGRELTHIGGTPLDIHPNDAGYDVIGRAFFDRLPRLEPPSPALPAPLTPAPVPSALQPIAPPASGLSEPSGSHTPLLAWFCLSFTLAILTAVGLTKQRKR